LHEAAQNFELLSNIQDQNKNKKPIVVDVLFKGYPEGLSIDWYHSHADPIWPDGTFKSLLRG
jgi:hypothetical protein